MYVCTHKCVCSQVFAQTDWSSISTFHHSNIREFHRKGDGKNVRARMSDKCWEVLISGLDMAISQHLCIPVEDPQEVKTLQNSALMGKRSMGHHSDWRSYWH